MSRERSRSLGVVVLIAASLIVAASILLGGSIGRVLNGAAGLLWISSLVLVWFQIGPQRTRLPLIGTALVITLVLVVLVQPSNMLVAGVGFAPAGAMIGILAGHAQIRWAAIIPALWLPLHLMLAIGGSLVGSGGGEASVSTDPPPTDAFVPFTMVIAALIGGLAGARTRQVWRPRRRFDGPSSDTAAATSDTA